MEEENKQQIEELNESVIQIVKNGEKNNVILPKDIEKLKKEYKDRFDFDKILKEISLKSNYHVIFIDGNEALVYDNGELFIENTLDKTKTRKKKKKLEAKNMYIEYFMKYQLNYILKQKQINAPISTITKENIEATSKDSKIKLENKKIIKEKKISDKKVKDNIAR